MPRGRKPGSASLSIEDQLLEIDVQLEKELAKIQELKEKKRKLNEHKRERDMQTIFQAMQERNMTTQDLLVLINKNQEI